MWSAACELAEPGVVSVHADKPAASREATTRWDACASRDRADTLTLMFDKPTVIRIEGLDVSVARRPGTRTFDITLPTYFPGPAGFTVTYFPEGAVGEDALREEISQYIKAVREQGPDH